MGLEEHPRHSEERFSDPKWVPPKVRYGTGLIKQATDTQEKYVVATMEIPWDLVKAEVKYPPSQVIFVDNMHKETLQQIETRVPTDIEMVIGVGGGSSHDTAKYIALKRNARLLQFPTIFGGDAVVTTSVGIRDQGRVRYIGHVVTDELFVDFDVIRSAPHPLVRYGAADILSSYTALLDWRLAAQDGKDSYDKPSAEFAEKKLLGRLRKNASEIRLVSDKGIRTIVDLYLAYHQLANRLDTDRPQEGSEHFFAYNAEYVTKRTFLHGALLSLGIWVVAGFYYDRRKEIEELLNELGLEHSLKSAGLSKEEFRQTLLTLRNFATSGGYYYSIVHKKEIDAKFVEEVIDGMVEVQEREEQL